MHPVGQWPIEMFLASMPTLVWLFVRTPDDTSTVHEILGEPEIFVFSFIIALVAAVGCTAIRWRILWRS